jgi:transposase
MARTELVVSVEEAQQLKRVVKRHSNWRVRERAQTLLLLAQGKKATQVALEMELHPQTVGSTRRQWEQEGMASLSDKPRSGAPAKLSEPQVKQLVEWASTEPLSRTTLKARHEEAGGVVVHVNTLTSVLKRAGLVWKRTRHSLQKKEMNLRSSRPRQTLWS